jgi:DNA-binding beta-propeller fold protein YncE
MVDVSLHHLVVVATADSLLYVDVDRDSVVARVPADGGMEALVWSASTDQVYCANSSHEVAVFTGGGGRVVARLGLGYWPFALALAPKSGRVYVGDLGRPHVYVIRDTTSGIQEQLLSGSPAAVLVARPNPFARSVAIVWHSRTKDGDVVRVYAQDGRVVRQARMPASEARWVWDGRDGHRRLLPPGVYVLAAPGGARAKAVKLR